jgi:hypothetical protein
VNSKHVLLFAVAALVGIAFYVIRARERTRHGGGSLVSQVQTETKTQTPSQPSRASAVCNDGCVRAWTKCNHSCDADDRACSARCDKVKDRCVAACN